MSLDREAGFWEWFDAMRGDLSVREIEKRARCPRGRIGNAYRKRAATKPILEAIVDGLGLPEDDVFRQAGWLSPPLAQLRATDPDLDRACHAMVQLPQAERSILYRIVAALGQERMDTSAAQDLKQFMGYVREMTDEELQEFQNEIRELVQQRERREDAPETGAEFGEM